MQSLESSHGIADITPKKLVYINSATLFLLTRLLGNCDDFHYEEDCYPSDSQYSHDNTLASTAAVSSVTPRAAKLP
jgi:hypothetical protein